MDMQVETISVCYPMPNITGPVLHQEWGCKAIPLWSRTRLFQLIEEQWDLGLTFLEHIRVLFSPLYLCAAWGLFMVAKYNHSNLHTNLLLVSIYLQFYHTQRNAVQLQTKNFPLPFVYIRLAFCLFVCLFVCFHHVVLMLH